MRYRPAVSVLAATALVTSAAIASASSKSNALSAPSGLTAHVATRSVELAWQSASFPSGVSNPQVVLTRDGTTLAALPATATSYSDAAVTTGQRHRYRVAETAVRSGRVLRSPSSSPITVRLPDYLVGAATEDITLLFSGLLREWGELQLAAVAERLATVCRQLLAGEVSESIIASSVGDWRSSDERRT